MWSLGTVTRELFPRLWAGSHLSGPRSSPRASRCGTSESMARLRPLTPALSLLRIATLVLAWVHMFPARHHLALFFTHPSLSEAWKGIGALVAVGLYVLPPATQGRLLVRLWKVRIRSLPALSVLSLALVAAHCVPAADHMPKFLAAASWGDGWRGFGSTLAALWFLAPLSFQARLLGMLVRVTAYRRRAGTRVERGCAPVGPSAGARSFPLHSAAVHRGELRLTHAWPARRPRAADPCPP